MVKKVKLVKEQNTNFNHFKVVPRKEDEFQNHLIEMIQKEQYLGAYLAIQQKLRSIVNQMIEDKRTEGIN